MLEYKKNAASVTTGPHHLENKTTTAFSFLTAGVSSQVHHFKEYNLNQTKCSWKQSLHWWTGWTHWHCFNGFECHLGRMCIESLENNETRCTWICSLFVWRLRRVLFQWSHSFNKHLSLSICDKALIYLHFRWCDQLICQVITKLFTSALWVLHLAHRWQSKESILFYSASAEANELWYACVYAVQG